MTKKLETGEGVYGKLILPLFNLNILIRPIGCIAFEKFFHSHRNI